MAAPCRNRQFAGTCGHPIAPGGRFVVVEPRPQFFCAACGKAQLAKEYRAQIEEQVPAIL